AAAEPGEQCAARILSQSQHAGSREPVTRRLEAAAAVPPPDDVRLELGSCVDRLPIAAIYDDAREYPVEQAGLRQELQVVTAVRGPEQVVRGGEDHVRIGRGRGDRPYDLGEACIGDGDRRADRVVRPGLRFTEYSPRAKNAHHQRAVGTEAQVPDRRTAVAAV